MGRPLKYGQVGNEPSVLLSILITTGVVFKNLSGHFMKDSGDGKIELLGATGVNAIGWAEQAERTSVSGDKADVNVCLDAVYEIPASKAGTSVAIACTEAELAACVGKKKNIVMIATSYQHVDQSTNSVGILYVVGYAYYGSGAGEQSLFVRLNTDKVAAN